MVVKLTPFVDPDVEWLCAGSGNNGFEGVDNGLLVFIFQGSSPGEARIDVNASENIPEAVIICEHFLHVSQVHRPRMIRCECDHTSTRKLPDHGSVEFFSKFSVHLYHLLDFVVTMSQSLDSIVQDVALVIETGEPSLANVHRVDVVFDRSDGMELALLLPIPQF